jgi:hypothetical protein
VSAEARRRRSLGRTVAGMFEEERLQRIRPRPGSEGDRTFEVYNVWPADDLYGPVMHVENDATIVAVIHEIHVGTVDVTLMYGAGDTVVDTFSLTTTTTEDTLTSPVTVPAGDRIRISFSSASDMADGIAFTVVFG